MAQQQAVSEEEKKLLEAFRTLGLHPKADTKEDLERWMQDYVDSKAQSRAVRTMKTEKEEGSDATQVKIWPHQPRISAFSGKDSEATYDLWKYEVSCLQADKSYKDSSILEAIRRSLRGEAARVAMRLRVGPSVTLTELLAKFDSVYGTVQLKQTILADFYSARQREDEDTTQWSGRLEDLLAKAVEVGQVDKSQTSEMLRCMLWAGLRQDLKDRTAHTFDTVQGIDEQRRAIRQIEQNTRPTKKAAVKSAQANRQDGIEAQLKKMSAEANSLKQEFRANHSQKTAAGQADEASGVNTGSTGNVQWKDAPHSGGRHHRPGWSDDGPICYRCGEKGHMQAGCRVRLDHRRRPLKFRQYADAGNL